MSAHKLSESHSLERTKSEKILCCGSDLAILWCPSDSIAVVTSGAKLAVFTVGIMLAQTLA